MSAHAPAGARSTRHRVRATSSAVAERLAVLAVIARLAVLPRVGRAVPDVRITTNRRPYKPMAELKPCKHCLARAPYYQRPLHRLPPSVFNSAEFSDKERMALVCEECDGPVYAMALKKHAAN